MIGQPCRGFGGVLGSRNDIANSQCFFPVQRCVRMYLESYQFKHQASSRQMDHMVFVRHLPGPYSHWVLEAHCPTLTRPANLLFCRYQLLVLPATVTFLQDAPFGHLIKTQLCCPAGIERSQHSKSPENLFWNIVQLRICCSF